MKINTVNQRKHILFLVASLGIGGAQKIAAFVANCCIEGGYAVSMLVLQDEPINVELDNDVNIVFLNYRYRNRYIRQIEDILRVRKVICDLFPDLVVIFGSYTIPSFGALLSGVPIVGCERGDPFTYSRFRQILNRYLYKRYSFTTYQSEGAREYYGVDIEKSAVICNPCFPVNVIECNKSNVICAAGRLSIDKGFDTLIRAFNKIKEDIPNYKVIIYGDGPYKEELENLINELRLADRVILYGKVHNLTDYMAGSKLFVLASWYEGLPNVLIEAMSLGIPIVATDCSPGGARFLMDNGKRGGKIVPINNVDTMANAILYMLSHQNEARELGERGKELIELYSTEKISNQWLEVVRKVLSDNAEIKSRK